MQDATLFFGVGATKAGTSWLHSQLQAHPDCHLRSIKELHYFGLTTPQHMARALRGAEADLAAARIKAATDKRDYTLRRVADLTEWVQVLQAGPGAYDRYLAYVAQGAGTRRLMGDVTPAYGLLPAETLTMMARLTPDVRFLYLMRDPVERLWSHVRMVCVRNDKAHFAEGALRMMEAILGGQTGGEIGGILTRGDYCAILDKLALAVPERQRLALFYEDMFAPGGLVPVAAFLGIGPITPAVQSRVHAGVPLELPPDLLARARAFLQPHYDGVRHRLGTVPAAWG